MARNKRRDRDGIFQRKGAYWISFNDAQGRRHQRKLQGVISVTKAKEIRNAELAAVEKAKVLGYTPPGNDTFAEIMPRYLQHQQARLTPRAYERSRGIVEDHLQAAFGTMRLASIRRVDVQRYITNRMGEVSAASVVREVNTLKHLLNYAVELEIIPVNPASRLGKKNGLPRVAAGRIRYLQPTELHAVLAACPEWLRPIAGLLAFTAMRRSEVLGLRWLDVDRAGGRIMLPQTKNGDGRIVWLNTLACQVLDSLSAGATTARVFSEDIAPENVSLAFLRTCRKVGIADFRLHDLRHTAASWARMNGADLQDVAKLLGHRDLRMTMRYAHLSPAHEAGVVKRLDTVFSSELKALPPPAKKGQNRRSIVTPS